MLKEDKVRCSRGLSSGYETSWLWAVLHRGLWVCWHSRATVVWEQLSHLAPAESRWYLPIGCLIASVCVYYEYLCQYAFVWRSTLWLFYFIFFFAVYERFSQSHTLLSSSWLSVSLSVCWPIHNLSRLPQPQPPALIIVLPVAFLSNFTPACHIPSYRSLDYIPVVERHLQGFVLAF